VFSVVTKNIDDSSAGEWNKFLAMGGLARQWADVCRWVVKPLNLDEIYIDYWEVSMELGSIAMEPSV
jgi:hypothetical protein